MLEQMACRTTSLTRRSVVIQVPNKRGDSIPFELPAWLVSFVVLAISTILGFSGWMALRVVEYGKTDVNHEQRLLVVESNQFTPEDFMLLETRFIPRTELERMENNILRELERLREDINGRSQ